MPYAHRPIHDADAHFMETPDWFHAFADPDVRAKLPPTVVSSVKPGEDRLIEKFRAQHADPAYRAEDEAQLLTHRQRHAAPPSLSPSSAMAVANSSSVGTPMCHL